MQTGSQFTEETVILRFLIIFSITEEYWKNGKFAGEICRKNIGLLGNAYDRVCKPYDLIKNWVKDRFLSA